MFFKKKTREENLEDVTMVTPAVYNGKLATFENFLILQVNSRYVVTANGDVRTLCTLCKISHKLWSSNSLICDWAKSHGYDPDKDSELRVPAVIVPAWALKKIKFFKPTSSKNVKRAIAYLIAQQTFPMEYITPDLAIQRLSDLGKPIADSDEKMNQKNFKRLEYLIDMLTQKKESSVLSDAEIEMVVQFIAAITEGVKPRDIHHAVSICVRKRNADIQKKYRQTKTRRKDGKAPKDYSDYAAPATSNLRVEDDDDDLDDDEDDDDVSSSEILEQLKKRAEEVDAKEKQVKEKPEETAETPTSNQKVRDPNKPTPPRNRAERRKMAREAKKNANPKIEVIKGK